MNIDRNEACAICGLARHAHWGRSPLAAGRCSGFEMNPPQAARERIAAEIEKALTKVAGREPADRAAIYAGALETIRRML